MHLRKTLFAFLSAISFSMALHASLGVGDWRIYNTFNFNVGKVIDTKEWVYFLNAGNLFAYNKQDESMLGFTTQNGMSDNAVTDIFSHPERSLLIAAYANGNLDIVLNDGNIANVSDIKDAQRLNDKTIRDIAFKDNVAYIATGFGVVKLNLDNFTVLESGIFNQPVTAIATVGNQLVLNTNGTLYNAPIDALHNTLSGFRPLTQLNITSLEPLNDTQLLASDGKKVWVVTVDFNSGTAAMIEHDIPSSGAIQRIADKLQVSSPSRIYLFDRDGTYSSFPIPDTILNKQSRNAIRYNSHKGITDLWYMTEDGLGCIALSDNGGAPTVKMNPAHPDAVTVNDGVWNIHVGKASGAVFITNKAESRKVFHYDNMKRMAINKVTDGFVEDLTPLSSDVTYNNPNYKNTLRAGYNITEDPEEEDVLLIGTFWEGIYQFKDKKEMYKYDWTNFPLKRDWTTLVPAVAFDPDGNMWMYALSSSASVIAALPAEKRGLESVSADDWVTFNIKGFEGVDSRDAIILPLNHSKNRNLVLISGGEGDEVLAAYNTAGTITSTSDDSHKATSLFYDQDGNTFGPFLISAMSEDRKGNVWIGTNNGVVVMHNPAAMLNGTANVERVKVPRNDGTNYADYLLESQTVTGIAVDNSNRKWLSTTSSGVYLVTEDGKEIIANFNTDNSPLPSNEVLTVACDPHSNSVFFGTFHGLVEYGGDATPVADDYSEVYAYPNPVRPDYSGWITIAGLMDNSLVKIADAAGNVFFQTRSNGGSVTWDGCNSSGERVKTGVYYVFASQDGDGTSSGAVTKILVVN